jgi:hypothetical protein
MKTKNLILLGLAAVGGYFLWKKMGTGKTGDEADPLYAEYLLYARPIQESQAHGAEVYLVPFGQWKKMKGSISNTVQAIASAFPNRRVETVLQNGTIVAGVGEILPPSPMEMAWDYPGLQSSHAPGRIYKV